jgi:hypothetical protein
MMLLIIPTKDHACLPILSLTRRYPVGSRIRNPFESPTSEEVGHP